MLIHDNFNLRSDNIIERCVKHDISLISCQGLCHERGSDFFGSGKFELHLKRSWYLFMRGLYWYHNFIISSIKYFFLEEDTFEQEIFAVRQRFLPFLSWNLFFSFLFISIFTDTFLGPLELLPSRLSCLVAYQWNFSGIYFVFVVSEDGKNCVTYLLKTTPSAGIFDLYVEDSYFWLVFSSRRPCNERTSN